MNQLKLFMFLWMKVRKEPLCLELEEILERSFSSDFFHKSDEDLKMIGVSSIDSLFSKVTIDEKGTGEESTLVRRRPDNSEGENLVEKIDKSGFEEVNTLTSDVPTLVDYKDFNYDSCSFIDCISLLQSMINSPHAYEQNKAFTNHIVDAMMKAFEEKVELEVCEGNMP